MPADFVIARNPDADSTLPYILRIPAVPRAAVVVEDRYSSVFALERVRPAVVAGAIAECQVVFPGVPIVFCARKLSPPPLAPAPPSPAEVRAWAQLNGFAVSDRGRIPQHVAAAFREARERARILLESEDFADPNSRPMFPDQLGADDNARVPESVLPHLASELGWR